MSFIHDNASKVMKQSPIEYVRSAVLRGTLFDIADTSGAISSVCTDFFVDHVKPLAALRWIQENMEWPLDELLEGHEFLLILETRFRNRS